jgi:hypothetical protein
LATLGSRSPSRSRLLELISRTLSLVAFVMLLGAGWVLLSYLKSGLPTGASKSAGVDLPRQVVAAPTAVEVSQVVAAPLLVYAVTGDTTYYHSSGHLPSQRRRSALTEQAAQKRGLKPCPICLRPAN